MLRKVKQGAGLGIFSFFQFGGLRTQMSRVRLLVGAPMKSISDASLKKANTFNSGWRHGVDEKAY